MCFTCLVLNIVRHTDIFGSTWQKKKCHINNWKRVITHSCLWGVFIFQWIKCLPQTVINSIFVKCHYWHNIPTEYLFRFLWGCVRVCVCCTRFSFVIQHFDISATIWQLDCKSLLFDPIWQPVIFISIIPRNHHYYFEYIMASAGVWICQYILFLVLQRLSIGSKWFYF